MKIDYCPRRKKWVVKPDRRGRRAAVVIAAVAYLLFVIALLLWPSTFHLPVP